MTNQHVYCFLICVSQQYCFHIYVYQIRITSEGCENLTLCPRAIEEVLDVMSGGAWPPNTDVLPEMKRRWATCKKGKMEFLDM